MQPQLAHNILVGLCEVKNGSSSALGKPDPITPRVNYIFDTLIDMELHENLYADLFNDSYDKTETLFYINIEVKFDAGTDTSVMYIAHHDVNNPHSDNCQDNSASVANLLALAQHFKENPPAKTVHIVFTDCEEFGGDGAMRLANRINDGHFGQVEYVVNLELTANGSNLWMDTKNMEDVTELVNVLNENGNFTSVKTPFNDSFVLRGQDIDSVCIGTLTNKDFQQVLSRGYCETWSLCHKENDTIDNAVSDDMDNFVEFLTKLV